MQRKSVALLTLVQFGAASLGIAQTTLVAFLFGTSRQVEIYMAASGLNALAIRLFQSGQIYEVFLPAYVSVKRELGTESANELASVLVNWMLFFFLVVFGVLFIFASTILNITITGFSDADRAMSVQIFRALLPVLGLQLFSGIFLMLGNAEKSFSKAQIPALIATIASMLVLLFFGTSLGAWALVVAIWVNQLITVFARIFLLLRMGITYRPRLHTSAISLKQLSGKVLSTLPSTLALTLFESLLSRELSLLSQGDYAIVNYSRQIATKIRGLLVRPTSVVFFTSASEHSSDSESKTRPMLESALNQLLLLVACSSMALWYSLPYLLFAIYHSEKFPIDRIHKTATLTNWLVLALLFSGVGVVYQKYNVAKGHVAQQYGFMAAATVISTTLAFLLIEPLGFTGAAGVLVLQAVGYALAGCLATLLFGTGRVTLFSWKPIICWAAIWNITWCACWIAEATTGFGLSENTSRIQSLATAGFLTAFSLAIAFSLGVILRIPEISDFVQMLKKHVSRGQDNNIAV